jgi:hypothetical protein
LEWKNTHDSHFDTLKITEDFLEMKTKIDLINSQRNRVMIGGKSGSQPIFSDHLTFKELRSTGRK